MRFLETSAKDCKNVEEAFIMMTREIKDRVAITQPKKAATGKRVKTYLNTDSGNAKLKAPAGGKQIKEKKGGCC